MLTLIESTIMVAAIGSSVSGSSAYQSSSGNSQINSVQKQLQTLRQQLVVTGCPQTQKSLNAQISALQSQLTQLQTGATTAAIPPENSPTCNSATAISGNIINTCA